VDVTWYVLKAMSWLGLVWDLKPVPERIRAARTRQRA
jgi:stearoyl-CoA desaturase (delta-9 desaturase)